MYLPEQVEQLKGCNTAVKGMNVRMRLELNETLSNEETGCELLWPYKFNQNYVCLNEQHSNDDKFSRLH